MRRTLGLFAIGVLAFLPSAQARNLGDLNQEVAALSARSDRARLRQALRERAEQWKRLAASNPKQAVDEALPRVLRDRLRREAELADLVESKAEASGSLEHWVADDFDSGGHRDVYVLKTGEGRLDLHFADSAPSEGCARQMRVEGFKLGERMAVTRIVEERDATYCVSTGDQKLAVILVNLSDASLPSDVTAASVRSLYFGGSNSLDAFWREASFSKASASGEVFGPYNIGITYQCNENDVWGSTYPVLQAAIAAADGQADFRQYTHVVVIVPGAKACSLGGFASIGCTDLSSPGDGAFKASRTFIRADKMNLARVTHEAGHTLGLNHSGAAYFTGEALGSLGTLPQTEEYGNPYDTMGGAHCNGDYVGHYAVQNKASLGWLLPANVQSVEGSGTFTVNPLETASSGTQTLRVRRGVGTDQWLWIEYRRAVGFDATFQTCSPTPYGGVLVYLENPLLADGRTRLLDFNNSLSLANNGQRKAFAAALNAGQTWTDPYTQLKLEVLSAGSAASVRVTYETPCASISPASATHSASAQNGSVQVSAAGSCSGTVVSNASWITVNSGASFTGSTNVSYSLPANTTPQRRSSSISIGRRTFAVTQESPNGQPVPVSSNPSSGSSSVGAAQRFRFVFSDPDGGAQIAEAGAVFNTSNSVTNACHFSYRASDRILRLFSDDAGGWAGWSIGSDHLLDNNGQCNINTATTTAVVSGTTLELTVDVIFQPGFTGAKTIYLFTKDTPGGDSGRIAVGSWTVNPSTAGLRFVPVTPCRLMDTRASSGMTGAFGPPSLNGSLTRTLPIASSSCGIPPTARAYALNVTAVPAGPLGFLSVWPTGVARPGVSTLNSFEGRVVANSAIVPAGTSGSIDLYATNATDVVVDITGYFTETGNLVFYPMTPCRVIDTRAGQGTTGAFGPPSFSVNQTRTFPLPQGRCGIPASAQAYSLNFTVSPPGPLSFLTAWPSGQSRPLASTLNSFEGRVVANGAIVPAGNSGGIDIFATNTTDVIADINGYFAPDDGSTGLAFRTLTPCRALDTRVTPPAFSAASTRTVALAGSCGVPAGARAYAMNLTVVPPGALSYLTAWASGSSQPFVSTLNSFDGRVVANAALVPAGADGSVSVFVTNATDLIIDLSGYFSR